MAFQKKPLKSDFYQKPLKSDFFEKPLKSDFYKKPLKSDLYQKPLKCHFQKAGTRRPRTQDPQDFVLLFLHGGHPVRETDQCHLDDQQKQEDTLTYMCLCTFNCQVVEGRITLAPDTPEARKNCPPKMFAKPASEVKSRPSTNSATCPK